MSNIGTIFLFTNQTTDANSTAYSIPYSNKTAVVKVWGTFGGASVKFQTLAPHTSASPVWIDVPDFSGNLMTFIINGQRALLFLIQGEQLRAVQSGSTGTTTLNVSVEMY
jgi:hypothetical protein